MSDHPGAGSNQSPRRSQAGKKTTLRLIGAAVVALLAFLGVRGRKPRHEPVPPPRSERPSNLSRPKQPAQSAGDPVVAGGQPAEPRQETVAQANEKAVAFGPVGPVTTRIEIPWRTIVRVVMAIALLWLFLQLWSQVVVVFIAVVLTLALDPPVTKLVRRGWSRGRAVLAVMIGLMVALAVLIAIIVPPLVDQGTSLAENLPEYVEDFQGVIDNYPTVDQWVDEVSQDEGDDPKALIERATTFLPSVLSFGAGIVSGVVSLFFLLVLTIYLLLDGPRLFETYTSRLNPVQRARMRRLRLELTKVVSGYVFGQAIVSLSFGVFTFVTLTIAGAPEPLLLAVLAAFLDAIPMIGATLATIPAVILSLTVSVPTALVVLALFLVYQQLENNVIAPRAFRNTLKISSLVVLIAVSFGSALFGVLGAMLALPVAAALPALIRALRHGVPLPVSEDPELSWPAEPAPREHRSG